MKTILVVTELYPNVTNTFLGTFVVRQLRALQNNYDITVLTTHFIPLAKIFSVRQPRFRDDHGIRVVSLRYYPVWLSVLRLLGLVNDRQVAAINKRVTAKKLVAEAKKLHKKYHFDFVHGHEIYIGDEAIPVGEALRIPSVFTLHGLYEYHLQGFGEVVMGLVLKNLRRAKKIIAVSKIAADTYLRQGVHPEKLEIIPNGIEWQETPPPSLEIHNFARGRLTLLTVGFMAKEKRMDQVIRSLGALRKKNIDAVLVIVGRGEMEPELHRFVEELQLAKFVRFMGEVIPANLPPVYSTADIVVHPSVVDSFSMVCLEAMSFGKPVVCTSNIGITEYTTSGIDIIVVPPDDEPALQNAVEKLASDKTLRQSIGQAAQKTAKTLTTENVSKRISDFYARL